MKEEMILKVSFCSKGWFLENADTTKTSDTEKESLDNLERGNPCIIAMDKYPVIDVYAVFPDCKEISLSNDIYPNIVEMAVLLKDIEDISNRVEVSLNGFDPGDTIKHAILEVLVTLMPQFTFYYLNEDEVSDQ